MVNKETLAKREQLDSIAERLEARAKLIRSVVGHCRTNSARDEEIPNDLKMSGDDYMRLFFNNDEKDITGDLTYRAVRQKTWGYGESTRVLYCFAERGDPLAEKIMEYHRNTRDSSRMFDCDGPCSQIALKMASRKLTKEEYFGYLEGRLPINFDGYIDKKPVFLPQNSETVEAK